MVGLFDRLLVPVQRITLTHLRAWGLFRQRVVINPEHVSNKEPPGMALGILNATVVNGWFI